MGQAERSMDTLLAPTPPLPQRGREQGKAQRGVMP